MRLQKFLILYFVKAIYGLFHVCNGDVLYISGKCEIFVPKDNTGDLIKENVVRSGLECPDSIIALQLFLPVPNFRMS